MKQKSIRKKIKKAYKEALQIGKKIQDANVTLSPSQIINQINDIANCEYSQIKIGVFSSTRRYLKEAKDILSTDNKQRVKHQVFQ